MTDFVNVFKADVTEEYVEMFFGYCPPELLQEEDEISEKSVENVKTIKLEHASFKAFFETVASLGFYLQRDLNVEVGFEIEEKTNE